MALPRVFISMGTPYNDELTRFRDSLEVFLRDRCNVDPRIIGKNEYPDGNPLAKIKSVMSTCDGVVVVAYERKFVQAGIEKRTGPNSVDLANRIYTTPWNHIESSMAYSLGIPLYILCQRGLAEEGLIESKIDWYVQYLDLRVEALSQPDVCQSLFSWVQARVIPRNKTPRLAKSIGGTLRLSEMTPKEIFALVAILSGAFTAGAAAAKLLPALFSQ